MCQIHRADLLEERVIVDCCGIGIRISVGGGDVSLAQGDFSLQVLLRWIEKWRVLLVEKYLYRNNCIWNA